MKVHYLHPGEWYWGHGDLQLRTVLGSCIAVTFWHPRLRCGGMCHFLLPDRSPAKQPGGMADGRYGPEAIALLAAKARHLALPEKFEVKMFGGASALKGDAGIRVGERNIAVARLALAELGYRILAEDVGGRCSRHVVLELPTGDVWVRRGAAELAPGLE